MAHSPLVASALVIGSMSPDIPYCLPLFVGSEATHSPVGVVSIDVLLSLAVFMAWHGFLTRPAIDCAPAAVRGRIPPQGVHPAPRSSQPPGVFPWPAWWPSCSRQAGNLAYPAPIYALRWKHLLGRPR